jgi:hypothetical protein
MPVKLGTQDVTLKLGSQDVTAYLGAEIVSLHPEAVAWRDAVVDNGGSVSGATLAAVSDFCNAIDAAGIRDRFYRLNLFAGTGLNAALVPLYRGPTYLADPLGSELWSPSTPSITDAGGSSGAWDGSTLTASNSVVGTNGGYPRFQFSLPLTIGKRYAVSGKLTGDTSAVGIIRLSSLPGASNVSYNPGTGVFSARNVSAASALMEFVTNGTLAYSVSIASVSVREELYYGNATDTNNGPFVSGDFSEATGLDGNQTTKYLNTGLSQDDLPTQAVGHASVWKGAGSVGAGTLALAGSTSPNGRNYYLRQNANTDYIAGQWASGAFATSSAADTSAGLVTLTRAGSSAAGAQIYKNDSLIVTGGGGVAEANGNDFIVFNVSSSTNTVGSAGWPYTISAYSFGDGLTGAQVGDFYDALSAFQTALGRP